MEKKLFKVRRSFTSYGNVYVLATDEDAAHAKAKDIDGGEFISEDDYLTGHSEITSVEETTDTNVDADSIYVAE